MIPAFELRFIPEPMSGCWLWIGSYDRNGYGRFWADGGHTQAHIISYEEENGPVPEGLELDHKCRVRCCVNPQHLEPVTHAENILRGLAPGIAGSWFRDRTHCPQGHPYDDANTHHCHRIGVNGKVHAHRNCRMCARLAARIRRATAKCS